jgi:hypothetical protein
VSPLTTRYIEHSRAHWQAEHIDDARHVTSIALERE